MTQRDDGSIAYPQVFTLHWEGPDAAEAPQEAAFEGEANGGDEDFDPDSVQRTDQGRALW